MYELVRRPRPRRVRACLRLMPVLGPCEAPMSARFAAAVQIGSRADGRQTKFKIPKQEYTPEFKEVAVKRVHSGHESLPRVERSMVRENDIRGRHKRRYKTTTDSKHTLSITENVLDEGSRPVLRGAGAAMPGLLPPYVPIARGLVYLAAWTGPAGECSPGAYRSACAVTSALRPWRKPSPATAHQRSSTLTEAASSRARSSPNAQRAYFRRRLNIRPGVSERVVDAPVHGCGPPRVRTICNVPPGHSLVTPS
jgi:hypothetical protein